MAVARYNINGSLDATIHPNGSVPGIVWGLAPAGSTESDDYGVLVQSNGTIVLAGVTYFGNGNGHLTLARITSTGQPDTTFGGSMTGFNVNSTVSSAFSIIQAPNGDLLTSGTSGNGTANGGLFGVGAYLPGGAPDTTFGANGIATTAGLSGTYARGRGVALQSDGKNRGLRF